MKIVSLSWQDFAGLSFVLCDAINRHTPHEAIAIRMEDNYIAYPRMLEQGDCPDEEILALIEVADVVHINDLSVSGLFPGLFADFWLRPSLDGKLLVKHHHTTLFDYREWSDDVWKMGLVLVSTCEMLERHPQAHWLPSPIPLDDYRSVFPVRSLPEEPVLVSYPATVADQQKGWPVLRDVVGKLQMEGLSVDIQVIAGQPHWVALGVIAQCHLSFDNLCPIHVSVSALEAACFERPVLVNPGPSAKALLAEWGWDFPFVEIWDRESLELELRRLIYDHDYRREKGLAGYRYVREVHDAPQVARRFIDLLEGKTPEDAR